jgi:NAD(P)-dependent dehydrogenase (short-subunit alcohol dehydrogenase family)
MQLREKVALVTGGGRGLGRAMALALAEAGAAVAVLARSSDEVAETVWLIEEHGGRGLALSADVRSSSQLSAAAAQIHKTLGPINVLVSSAGVGVRAPINELSEADWDVTLDTLLKGTFLAAQAVLPQMMALGAGNIINVSAPLDRIASPGFGAYYAAKCGVDGLTRVMAKDLRRYGINVNALHPGGYVDTRLLRTLVPDLRGNSLSAELVGPLAVALAAEAPRGKTGQTLDAHAIEIA